MRRFPVRVTIGADEVHMRAYKEYVDHLEHLVRRFSRLEQAEASRLLDAALDGQPSSALRSTIKIDIRRKSGAFFTGKDLADALVAPLAARLRRGIKIYDPACGAGDLLAACAYHLPVANGFESTIEYWGRLIHGMDIHPEFVRAAKARLLLVAFSRGLRPGSASINLRDIFPNLNVGNSLKTLCNITNLSVILLNPPYGKTTFLPEYGDWTSGSTSMAAVFVDDILSQAKGGTEILAILPDVLRTGSTYARWRTCVNNIATVKEIKPIGQFDAWTDVDVFTAKFRVRGENSRLKDGAVGSAWWSANIQSVHIDCRVGDVFKVRVGPVVPFRHEQKGPWYPYICPRCLTCWGTFDTACATRYRRFLGTVLHPPFVAIRRTSRPDDRYRAVATLIKGQRPVAVENHLIVLTPISNRLTDCRQLVRVLRSDQANEWLNDRIRCRHLTVPALAGLPWWDSGQ